jgi:hypothetical protein
MIKQGPNVRLLNRLRKRARCDLLDKPAEVLAVRVEYGSVALDLSATRGHCPYLKGVRRYPPLDRLAIDATIV